MSVLKEIIPGFHQIFFPHICAGCGSDLLASNEILCLHCLDQLPSTDFHLYPSNPVERIFWGRAVVEAATSHFYFTKHSVMQQVLHQFKYKAKKEIGIHFGSMMGRSLLQSGRFQGLEALVPLPLFPSKEKRRGYNQAAVLCEGISSILHIPTLSDVVMRKEPTVTQTQKSRIERWENIQGKFELKNGGSIRGKHVLLVDDVITTGATLDACIQTMSSIEGLRISVASLAFTYT